MARQKEIASIVTQVDGEFTDIQLVENILTFRADKARAHAAAKKAVATLVQRLVDRGVTEATVGDNLIVISPKLITDYDQTVLGSLKNCVTDEQLWLTMKQIPSGKQLNALSDLAGASAKAVIASAKRRNETDTTNLRIRKPRKRTRRL